MDFHQLIIDRRTVHDFSSEPLPEGALQRALTAALAAPNHRMTEPWRFVRVGAETRGQLLDIATDLKSKGGSAPLPPAARARLEAKMLRPAELIVVCQVGHDKPDIEREDYAAIACALQNTMLSLWSEGVGSKWSTGGITKDPRSYSLLGVPAGQESIAGFLWVGLPEKDNPPKAKRRRPLEQVLRELP